MRIARGWRVHGGSLKHAFVWQFNLRQFNRIDLRLHNTLEKLLGEILGISWSVLKEQQTQVQKEIPKPAIPQSHT